MFERLGARVRLRAEQRARSVSARLCERIGAELPPGVEAEARAEGVLLSGRGLARRWVIEPGLRWLIAGVSR